MIALEMKNLNKYSKSQVIDTCCGLWAWVSYLREHIDNLAQEMTHKNIENCFHIENLSKDKQRVDKKYAKLSQEHRQLENTCKQLQKMHLDVEHECRELKKQLEGFEEKYDAVCKNLEESKSKVLEKEKIISDLQKKVRITSSLSLPNVDKIKRLTPKNTTSHFIPLTPINQSSSITPKARGSFNFENIQENDSVKEQIIKNLKNELIKSNEKFSMLELEIKKLQKQNTELIEKIKLMSFSSMAMSEDEEDCKYETIESLRDEIAVIDIDFLNMKPLNKNVKVHEIGVQVNFPIQHKKKRSSCFSWFG